MNIDKTKQYLNFLDKYVGHLVDAYHDGYISKIDLSLILNIFFYDYCYYGEKWSQEKSERLSQVLQKEYLDKYKIDFDIFKE